MKIHQLQWVSTDDRLPPEETPVLIIHEGVVKIGERRWDVPGYEDTYEKYWYWDDPNNDGQDWQTDEVSHWMEIPKPEPE